MQIRDRLAPRVKGMPDDATLRAHLDLLSGPLIHTLLVSGPWATAIVGGEEVDIDWLLEGSQPEQPIVSQLAPPRLPGESRPAPSPQAAG